MNITNDNDNEHSLWLSFKQGSTNSFGKIFRLYYPSLYQFGSKLSNNRELVEDTIQELFIEMWQQRNTAEVTNVRAYLFQSLRYKLYRALQQKGSLPLPPDTEFNSTFSHEFTLVAAEEKSEQRKKIVNALNQLPARQKEIIYLKYYKELTYEQVSEIMHINYQAARNLLYLSVKALRRVMRDEFG